MGNAFFTYAPRGTFLNANDDIEQINVGRPVTHLEEIHVQLADVVTSYAGFVGQNNRSGVTRVRIVIEGLDDYAVVQQLYTMENYLNRGGVVGFYADISQGFVRMTSQKPSRGAAGIGGLFLAFPWMNDASILDDEALVLETMAGTVAPRREYHTANGNQSGTALSTVLFNESIVFDYANDPSVTLLVVRHRDLYPWLKLSGTSRGQGIIRPSRHRFLYNFDATFDYIPYILA